MAAISGTNGPDNLQGTPDDDVIEGLGGDDRIRGGGGRDELYGGDGNDVLDGTADSMSYLVDNVLSGGDGNDTLQPISYGSVGNPDNPPITLVDGGSGIDMVRILTDLPMTIDLSDPTTPQTSFTYVNTPLQPYFGATLVNIEQLYFYSETAAYSGSNITGGALDDYIAGGRADDILRGGGGDDILSGNDGRDTLLGGSGNDHLSMGLNDYTIDGGDGIDSIHFFGFYLGSETMIFSLADPSVEQTLLGATVRDVESISSYSYGTRGDDVVTGGAFDDVFSGWEGDDIIRGGGGDDELDGDIANFGDAGEDEIHGDAGSDRITGGGGDDLLYGGSDADRLSGDEGDDRLEGGTGADHLSGNEGSDTLIGGEGADVLSGGSGADIFIFAPGDVDLSYALRDKIDDFEVGVDKLDLTAFTDAVITVASDTRVKIDFDGDLRTDALIQVETIGGAPLTMADLIL